MLIVALPPISLDTTESPEVNTSKSYTYSPAVTLLEVAAGSFIKIFQFVGVGIVQVKLNAALESSISALACARAE